MLLNLGFLQNHHVVASTPCSLLAMRAAGRSLLCVGIATEVELLSKSEAERGVFRSGRRCRWTHCNPTGLAALQSLQEESLCGYLTFFAIV